MKSQKTNRNINRAMRRTRAICIFCAVSPAAAQFGFSLPALESVTAALGSLLDPKPATRTAINTPAPAPVVPTTQATPEASPTSFFTPTPVFTPSPQPTTLFTSTSEPTQRTGHTPLIDTSSKTSHETTTLAERPAASSPTETASSEGSGGGLSQGSKVAIGVTIGLLIFLGLVGAAIYAFVRNGHLSEAYTNWNERRRRQKHERIGSEVNQMSSWAWPALATISTASLTKDREKEKETSPVTSSYGNGTILGQPAAVLQRENSFDHTDYDNGRILGPLAVVNASRRQSYEDAGMTSEPQVSDMETPILDRPAVARVYEKPRQINIKRKAVPRQVVASVYDNPRNMPAQGMGRRGSTYWVD